MARNAKIVEEQAPRIIIRIELTPSAKERLQGVADARGMTQVSVSSRLVEWFASQTEFIQAAILGHYPQLIESEVAEIILKKMVEKRND